MSILIKGMEMPKNCAECWALDDYGDYPRCHITGEQHGYPFRYEEYRMPDCPLRPAPERERWIPVAERLPPLDTDVLVFSHGNISVCALIRIDNETADVAWEDAYGFWDDEEGVAAVTHWMHLPKPPKEEADV